MPKTVGSFNAATQGGASYFLEELHPYKVAANAANFDSEIDDKQVTVAFEARAVPKLVDLLKVSGLSASGRLQSLSYLKSLMSCQEEKLHAIKLGAVQACLGLIGKENEEVSAEASNVVRSLFDVRQGRAEATNDGMILPLITALQKKDLTLASQTLRESAAETLFHFSEFKDGAMFLIHLEEPTTIGAAIIEHGLVMPPSDDVKDEKLLNIITRTVGSCCRVLANIANYKRGVQQVLENQVIPRAYDLITSTKERTLHGDIWSMLAKVSRSEESKDLFLDERNFVDLAASCLSAAEEYNVGVTAQYNVCLVTFLMNIAEPKAGKILVEKHAVPVLTKQLAHSDHFVRDLAREAIIKASILPSAKKSFVLEMCKHTDWTQPPPVVEYFERSYVGGFHAVELVLWVFGEKVASCCAELLLEQENHHFECAIFVLLAIAQGCQRTNSDGNIVWSAKSLDAVASNLYLVEKLAQLQNETYYTERLKDMAERSWDSCPLSKEPVLDLLLELFKRKSKSPPLPRLQTQSSVGMGGLKNSLLRSSLLETSLEAPSPSPSPTIQEVWGIDSKGNDMHFKYDQLVIKEEKRQVEQSSKIKHDRLKNVSSNLGLVGEKIKRTPLAWSQNDVLRWLDRIVELPMYKEAFTKARIDGSFLLQKIDNAFLIQRCDVQIRLHRWKIMTEIDNLKKSMPSSFDNGSTIQTNGAGKGGSRSNSQNFKMGTRAKEKRIDLAIDIREQGINYPNITRASTAPQEEIPYSHRRISPVAAALARSRKPSHKRGRILSANIRLPRNFKNLGEVKDVSNGNKTEKGITKTATSTLSSSKEKRVIRYNINLKKWLQNVILDDINSHHAPVSELSNMIERVLSQLYEEGYYTLNDLLADVNEADFRRDLQSYGLKKRFVNKVFRRLQSIAIKAGDDNLDSVPEPTANETITGAAQYKEEQEQDEIKKGEEKSGKGNLDIDKEQSISTSKKKFKNSLKIDMDALETSEKLKRSFSITDSGTLHYDGLTIGKDGLTIGVGDTVLADNESTFLERALSSSTDGRAGSSTQSRGDVNKNAIMVSNAVPRKLDPRSVLLLERVGAGAGGIVYKAVHSETLTLFAVKVVKIFDSDQRSQMVRELKSLYETQSKHHGDESNGMDKARSGKNSIVHFYDAFSNTGSGTISIVLEFMDAGSLQNLIDSGTRLSEKILASIAFRVLQGLCQLHGNHLLHRDIKPSNILINRDGDVKISDFGISTKLNHTEAKTKSYVGTLLYMAPERITSEEYSFAADIWSMGMCILTCAIGHYPFQTDESSYWGLINSITSENKIVDLPDSFSPAFRSFCQACLQKNPQDRPRARELLQHSFFQLHQDHINATYGQQNHRVSRENVNTGDPNEFHDPSVSLTESLSASIDTKDFDTKRELEEIVNRVVTFAQKFPSDKAIMNL
eukprot:g4051.t1